MTVLTAVYNAQPYLRQCLDSLCGQTLSDCRFVCIDDCSTDGSYDILQEYARKDSRFCVLRTTVNSGQAKARNMGLEYARGEYVAMLDADDWFAPDTLEQAYRTLKSTGAPCALLQLVQHYEEDGREVLYPIRSVQHEWSGEEAFRLSLDWSLHGLYVVATDIHKCYPYDDSCRLYSDDNTTRLHFLASSKVVQCQGRYYYRKHAASMTNACSVRRFDHLLANLSMKEKLQTLALQDEENVLDFYETYRWLNVLSCYRYYCEHHSAFSSAEHDEIKGVFAKVLPTIERRRIPWRLKLKPGYCPVHNFRVFGLFQNAIYRLRQRLKVKR